MSSTTRLAVLIFASFAMSCGSSDATPASPTDTMDTMATPDTVVTTDAADVGGEAAKGTGTLGAECKGDADCGGDGTLCLTASGERMVSGTGPAGGYCSLDCLSYTDGTTDIDPCLAIGGRCFGKKGDTSAWCFEACDLGTMEAGTKCHGRDDVGCTRAIDRTAATTSNAYCAPTCWPGSDCGSGRTCDPLLARCIDATKVHTGDPTGTASASRTATTCAGNNVVVGVAAGTAYVCGTACVWGTPPEACGANAACVYLPAKRSFGDLAYCGQLCDTAADCLDKVHVVTCNTSSAAFAAKVHRAGFCEITGLGLAGDAGADAAGDAGTDSSGDSSIDAAAD